MAEPSNGWDPTQNWQREVSLDATWDVHSTIDNYFVGRGTNFQTADAQFTSIENFLDSMMTPNFAHEPSRSCVESTWPWHSAICASGWLGQTNLVTSSARPEFDWPILQDRSLEQIDSTSPLDKQEETGQELSSKVNVQDLTSDKVVACELVVASPTAEYFGNANSSSQITCQTTTPINLLSLCQTTTVLQSGSEDVDGWISDQSKGEYEVWYDETPTGDVLSNSIGIKHLANTGTRSAHFASDSFEIWTTTEDPHYQPGISVALPTSISVQQCPHPSCSSKMLFKRQCDVDKHYRLHFRKYFCRIPGCNKPSKTWYKTGQSPHSSFATMKDRNRHEKTHNPLISCLYCNKLFSRQDNLRNHCRKLHCNDSIH